MQDHCERQHGWVNGQKRGGDARLKQVHTHNKLWSCDRACQRFFKVGSWQRYFEVQVADLEICGRRRAGHQRDFFRTQEEDILQAERDAASAANRVRGFDEHRSTVVPWLRETGIVDHVCGLKKDEIRAAIAVPSRDEGCPLRTIVDAMEDVLREAHGWCFDGPDCMLTWPCRVVLSRFQSSQVESIGKVRPFDPYKEPGTLKVYFKLASQFLSYLERVAICDEYHFSADSEETIRPEDVIEPTDKQRVVWHNLRRLAERGATGTGEGIKGQLRDGLVELWMLVIRHTTGARRYRSPIVSFCAMLSIKPSTQGWMEPGNFNSSLAAGWGETLALVKECCESYLQQTAETPMGEILRWRLLLFRISKDSVGDHEACWDESEQVLTYEDTELRMDQIPTLLLSEYRECERLLYDDLLLGQKDLRRMQSWALRDSGNGTDKALLAAVERSEQLCRLFLQQDRRSASGFVWRDSALAGYEATVQEFLKRLCVLVHISGGQPIRESEFFSMTWRNTQRRRSITLRHDRVMIHVKYHKGQQQTGRYKENIRFLANPVGDLLLDYLVYVVPLRQVFLRQQSPKALLSSFLWEKDGKVWGEGRLSRCLEEASARACTPRLHVSNWRQMSVAIVKTKFASNIGCFEVNEDDEDAEEMEEDIRAMTRQRNHKTRTVNRAYANQTGATFGNVWDGLIRMGLRASTLWQDFWGVETMLKGKKRKRDGEECRLKERLAKGVYRPRKPWSAEALLEGLRKLYGNQRMMWKSREQEQTLTTIMSWTEQVVAILPTGAGKSLSFMLPCTLPDAGITILIVPLVSLRADLLRRIRELNIAHLEWLPGESREASLIIVSVEAAATTHFTKYARSLIVQQKLDRIVIDECHLTVTAVDYRSSIVDLTAVRNLRTQFVYLTATLPPSMKEEFEERNYLYRPTTIRASSNRPNIFYMVRRADPRKGSLLEQSAVEAQDAWRDSDLFDHSRDKIVLYVRTCEDADSLCQLLGCAAYTAKSGTPEQKKLIVDRWIHTSDRPYLVATTALAEGFDHAHESGRAGRDGMEAYSMVLLPATWQAQLEDDVDVGSEQTGSCRDDVSLRKRRDKQAVHKYLRGEQCFRTSLSEHLDLAQHRRWCMPEDVACDVCKAAHEDPIAASDATRRQTAHTGLDLIQQERLQAHSELVNYRLDLASVRGTCLLCRAMDEEWKHEFSKCARRHEVFHERSRVRQRHETRGRKWLRPYTSCFWCLNPQSICQRAELSKTSKEEACEHGDVVLPLCYGIFVSAGGARWLEDHFRRRFAGVEDFFDWLGEETRFGGGMAVQGVRVAAKALLSF
ncbi:hypothetical protein H2203_009313 [Taxawa tesnikishii (nom. ined.)]|nr:hypothetical protein H2203_009313 [Dothideales sp. JES 119]